MGGVLADIMAHKRSKAEAWRVREVGAVGIEMLAAAPHIKGGVAEELQGALVRRRAFETNDKVLAVMNSGSELPRRMAELAGGFDGARGGGMSIGGKEGVEGVEERKDGEEEGEGNQDKKEGREEHAR